MKVSNLVNMRLNNEKMPKKILVTFKSGQFEGIYNEELQDYRLGRYEMRFKDIYLFEYVFELGQTVGEEINRKEALLYDVDILEGEDNESN